MRPEAMLSLFGSEGMVLWVDERFRLFLWVWHVSHAHGLHNRVDLFPEAFSGAVMGK